ncbi:hypothetical protein SNE40_008510 [Patella caerulea]|uniref:C-type lectin domain-containing protein n=1 Tax=Patella caerulea TaxID=87958 RepID=A0AAN8PZ53_PATCE
MAAKGGIVYFLYWCLIFFVKNINGKDYYCSKELVEIDESGTGRYDRIISRYEDTRFYGNGLKCKWRIRTRKDQRILLTVIQSVLQWAPKSAVCEGDNYDYMTIKNDEEDSSSLVQWCGQRKPGWIISTGPELYMTFVTNDVNPYEYSGIVLNMQIFESIHCPPGWLSLPATYPVSSVKPSKKVCYGVVKVVEDWKDAQEICNNAQSNLASVLSQDLFAIKDLAVNSNSVGEVWIGLNDIVNQQQFVWLDNSPNTLTLYDSEKYKKDSDCAYLAFHDDITLKVSNCNMQQDRRYILCKMNEGEKTDLYSIPQAPIPKGSGEVTNPKLILGITLGILSFLLVIGVVFICFRRLKKRSRNQHTRQSTNNQARAPPAYRSSSGPSNTDPTNVPVTPSAPPMPDEPPSYEEAIRNKPEYY